MSQTTTSILLPQTAYSGLNGAAYTVVGNTYVAASYYQSNKDLQTAAIKLTAVTGNIILEASLVANPAETDWFKVYELVANNTSDTNSNASVYANLNGNFVNIRAKVENFSTGVINHIKVTY